MKPVRTVCFSTIFTLVLAATVVCGQSSASGPGSSQRQQHIEELKKEIGDLRTENSLLKEENDRLTELLALLKQHIIAKNLNGELKQQVASGDTVPAANRVSKSQPRSP